VAKRKAKEKLKTDLNENLKPLTEMEFHYFKNFNYRSIYIDGATCNINPHGKFHVDLYSTKFPIPEYAKHKLDGNKLNLKPVEERKLTGLIREIEVGIYMDAPTVQALIDMLKGQLEVFNQLVLAGGAPPGGVPSNIIEKVKNESK
jgi:hypothetical protein